MITRLLALSLAGLLSCVVFASGDINDVGITSDNYDLIMADNPRKDRRDDRRDDRHENRDGKQDCRHEEGLVGKDKRECKQEKRGEGDKSEGKDKNDDKGSEA